LAGFDLKGKVKEWPFSLNDKEGKSYVSQGGSGVTVLVLLGLRNLC